MNSRKINVMKNVLNLKANEIPRNLFKKRQFLQDKAHYMV